MKFTDLLVAAAEAEMEEEEEAAASSRREERRRQEEEENGGTIFEASAKMNAENLDMRFRQNSVHPKSLPTMGPLPSSILFE